MPRSADPFKYYTYRHPSWLQPGTDPKHPEGSGWVFRAERGDVDENEANALSTKNVVKGITPTTIRDMRKAGISEEDIEEWIQERIKRKAPISAAGAALAQATVRWFGPDFFVAGDRNTEILVTGHNGKSVKKIVPHPLRGQLMPCDTVEDCVAWVATFDPAEIIEYAQAMNRVWAGRTEQEQADFRPSNTSLDGSQPHDSGAQPEVGEPAQEEQRREESTEHNSPVSARTVRVLENPFDVPRRDAGHAAATDV